MRAHKLIAPKGTAKKVRERGKVLQRNESASTPGKFYEIRAGLDGVIYCTCPGWTMAKKRNGEKKEGPRTCKHLKAYSQDLDAALGI